jgi:hypothetical protein
MRPRNRAPVDMSTPFPNVALDNISASNAELLAGGFTGIESEQTLWGLPVLGGSLRRLTGRPVFIKCGGVTEDPYHSAHPAELAVFFPSRLSDPTQWHLSGIFDRRGTQTSPAP